MRDIDLLVSVGDNIAGKTLCAFGDAAATPALTTVKHFRAEFEAHVREGRCTLPADWRAATRCPVASALMMRATCRRRPVIAQLGLIFVVFNMLVLSAAFMVWMERKVCAYIQDRSGPNRVGSDGPLQPFADVIKLLFKEQLRPKAADAFLFAIAPLISTDRGVRRVLGRPVRRPRRRSSGCSISRSRCEVTDVNVAVLVIFAITSMGIYGIVLAGWSSNSKYSLLGGLRSLGADDQLRAVVRAGAGRGDHDGRARCRCARS